MLYAAKARSMVTIVQLELYLLLEPPCYERYQALMVLKERKEKHEAMLNDANDKLEDQTGKPLRPLILQLLTDARHSRPARLPLAIAQS